MVKVETLRGLLQHGGSVASDADLAVLRREFFRVGRRPRVNPVARSETLVRT